jgi:hypothetical protein
MTSSAFAQLVRHLALQAFLAVVPGIDLLAQDAVVTRNVNLRRDPSTANPEIRLLLPGTELRLLEPGRTNNYYHVATMGRDEGWVWGNNIRVHPPPPGPAEVINGCPMEGNASREDYRELNRLKNRVTAPQASDISGVITLAAILASGDDENRWANSQGAIVTGFVFDVKAGSEESVNCGARTVATKDTHIELTLSATDTGRARRVIAEVTPRWRSYKAQLGEDWSTGVLRNTLEGNCAELTGWMLWDWPHRRVAQNTDPGAGDNWRATAWEIHPVTSIRIIPSPG